MIRKESTYSLLIFPRTKFSGTKCLHSASVEKRMNLLSSTPSKWKVLMWVSVDMLVFSLTPCCIKGAQAKSTKGHTCLINPQTTWYNLMKIQMLQMRKQSHKSHFCLCGTLKIHLPSPFSKDPSSKQIP